MHCFDANVLDIPLTDMMAIYCIWHCWRREASARDCFTPCICVYVRSFLHVNTPHMYNTRTHTHQQQTIIDSFFLSSLAGQSPVATLAARLCTASGMAIFCCCCCGSTDAYLPNRAGFFLLFWCFSAHFPLLIQTIDTQQHQQQQPL